MKVYLLTFVLFARTVSDTLFISSLHCCIFYIFLIPVMVIVSSTYLKSFFCFSISLCFQIIELKHEVGLMPTTYTKLCKEGDSWTSNYTFACEKCKIKFFQNYNWIKSRYLNTIYFAIKRVNLFFINWYKLARTCYMGVTISCSQAPSS